MSTEGSNLDPATFDLDAWIDGLVRPEITVNLYPLETEFAAKVADIEAQIPAAEKVTPQNRGLDEATPEHLLAQIEAIKAERDAATIRVRVTQLTNAEIIATTKAAMDAGEDEDGKQAWLIAAACVEPKFTPAQVVALRDKSRSGAVMYAQLQGAVGYLLTGLPVPS